ncbi:MAG: tripartite tricarboxylate transporter substrate binding protein [Pseudomonadota bacterium]
MHTTQRRSSRWMRLCLWAGAGMALGLHLAAGAQETSYPSKPITLVVPFAAGSGTDVIGRLIGDRLGKQLGQAVVIENKAGAGGTLGAGQVAVAAPDGYTALVHSSGHVAAPALYPNLRYDTAKDFTPVAMLATLPNVLVVSPASGIKSVADLVRRAKANPGKMSYGSAGNGSAAHINAEKFRIAAGMQGQVVPYRGTMPAITDLIGGQIDWYFAPLVSALPLIKDNRLVALAVASPQRSSLLPDVPTTVEAGVPDSEYIFWVGLFVPFRTPPAVTARLAREVGNVLQMPDIKTAFANLGAEVPTMSQPQFADFVNKEIKTTGALIRKAGIKGD